MPYNKILATPVRILALTCCLALTACASLSIPKQPSDDYIAELLAQDNFDSALMAIDKWQADYPSDLELPKQRKLITQAISRFEKSTLTAAKQLDAAGKWQDAKHLYEGALVKLPSSQPLQNAYSEFSIRRLQYIHGLKEDLDVAQAKHWLAISRDIKAVYEAAPDDREARSWKERSDSEREQLARRLVDYGLAHEDNQHFGTAALRYDLAYKLAPGEFTKPYHERAAKTFAQRNATQQKRARENQQRQQSKLSRLGEEFDQYLAEEKFHLARQTLGAMEVIDGKAPEVLHRKAQLDQQRNIALDKAILDGKQFYTKGEFDNAIRAWKRALELDPDNKEIKENIQRAEKFRENLERLKQDS
ncbi:MAG: hypothetical protein CMK89_12315 [Pseudomonadales bacterium]|nr:hypothetical protein [Pseudomonadales bacterium]